MKNLYILSVILGALISARADEFDPSKAEILQNEIYKCSTGNMHSCAMAGTVYSISSFAEQYGVEVDFFTANKYLKQACDGNEAVGCFNLAVSYDLGEGVSKDAQKAIELYEKACELDHANACYVLGGHMHNDMGDKGAVEYFVKACKLGEYSACNDAGAMYFNQDNMERALKCFQKACEHGDEWGCKNANMIE